MKESFFFYDLETSGINPRHSRIMQFAGQRTNMELEPIGEPVDMLISLSDDVLPDPRAILITGITPQQTKADGVTEREFLQYFHENVAVENTVFVGFNSLRFDDEFMRYLHYRNFYDPYEWHWRGDRSRWDLLDVIRMTRALRPEGLSWPIGEDGVGNNRLEELAKVNKLPHESAHNALSDVRATIALAQLVRSKQPKLFNYLFSIRKKNEIKKIVNSGNPFVYSSGKYENEFEKTTVVGKVANHPDKQGAIVFDLRYDPAKYLTMTPKQLAEAWTYKKDNAKDRLPAKTLQYNRCPAIAPLNVLNEDCQTRLQIDIKKVQKHYEAIMSATDFGNKLAEAIVIMNKGRKSDITNTFVDERLYDGFLPEADKPILQKVRSSQPESINELVGQFKDKRYNELLPLYKARNFPNKLSGEEISQWQKYKFAKLCKGSPSQLERFYEALQDVAKATKLSSDQLYILEELQLYAESITPEQE